MNKIVHLQDIRNLLIIMLLELKRGETAILDFAIFWYAPEQKGLREKVLKEIQPNEILGCWCKPNACHVDIIVGYLEWRRKEQ